MAGGRRRGQAAATAEVDRLYREEYARLVRTATMITGRQAVAEELVQDAFIKVLQRWQDLRTPAAFLRTVVVRQCTDHGRRETVAARHRSTVTETYALPPDLDEMWDRLQHLSPEHRTVLILRYYEDLTVDEISHLMACRPGTTKSRINRALAQLRQEVTR